MSTFLKPISVQETLLERNVTIFTPQEFVRLFRVTQIQAKYFLESYTKRGLLIRFRRGLYGLKSKIPLELVLANRLYQPSYVSFEYALSYHNMIPEAVYTVTSATTKPTREFIVLQKSYRYHTIKKIAFCGYVAQEISGQTVLIADREKALVDYLYFVSLNKNSLNDRLNTRHINRKKANEYAGLYERQRLTLLINQLLS